MANLSLSENVGHVKLCHTSNYQLKTIQNFPSKGYFGSHVTVLVLSIFLSLFTILLNFITIATFRSSTQLQKKACHFLIFVQSCHDFSIGLIVLPLFSIVIAGELVGSTNCALFFTFYIIFFTTSGFSVVILSAMNLERYASIVHPVYHRNSVTKLKLLGYIISLCAVFVFVSLASVRFGRAVLAKFVGYVFLSHFFSTVYFYTRIFLVGKAQLTKSKPRHVRQDGVQIRGNDVPQENCLSCRSDDRDNRGDNQGKPLDNQGDSSNTRGRLRDDRSGLSGQQSNNQGASSESRNNGSHSTETLSNKLEEKSGNQSRRSVNQGSTSDNQSDQSDSQCNRSDNQSHRSDNHGNRSDTRSDRSDNQSNRLDNQRNRSDNQSNQSDNQTGHTGQNNQQNSSNENNNPSNRTSSNIKSEQEFLVKFKLAKSCLIVVVCSFAMFALPALFQPLQLSDFIKVVINGWFTVLVLSNAILDSLIFFWKNNMLRNEAKKFLKKVCS